MFKGGIGGFCGRVGWVSSGFGGGSAGRGECAGVFSITVVSYSDDLPYEELSSTPSISSHSNFKNFFMS